jgi:hypothetical protein
LADYLSTGQLRGDLIMVEICERMGWDWYTYHNQPAWFIQLIEHKMGIEAKRQEREAKRTPR